MCKPKSPPPPSHIQVILTKENISFQDNTSIVIGIYSKTATKANETERLAWLLSPIPPSRSILYVPW